MLKRWFYRVVLMTAMAALWAGVATAGDEAPRIGKDEVKAKLGAADMTIIDVRAPTDWMLAKVKIKGAVREDPKDAAKWASHYPKDRTLILYCA